MCFFWTLICTHTHTLTHTYSCTHTYTLSHTHTHTCTRLHTLSHTYMHAHTHSHTHTCSHTHAYTHTHMHTCAYTLCHTHAHIISSIMISIHSNHVMLFLPAWMSVFTVLHNFLIFLDPEIYFSSGIVVLFDLAATMSHSILPLQRAWMEVLFLA